MADQEIEFSLRIDFFSGRDEAGDAKGDREYAGSMVLETVRAARLPRTGEYIHMLNPWMPYPYAPVSAVEHHLGGVAPYEPGADLPSSPSIILVVKVPWPGDNVKDEVLKDFDTQGWTWAPTAAEILARRDEER